MTDTTSKRYKVGVCPACQANIEAVAILELDATPGGYAPDPRNEGKVTLQAKITGACVLAHDCRKKATR